MYRSGDVTEREWDFPIRSVTPEEVAAYERDGFVKLEGVLAPGWIEAATSVIDDFQRRGVLTDAHRQTAIADSLAAGVEVLVDGDQQPAGRFCSSVGQWKDDDQLRDLCTSGAAPHLAAELFQVDKLNFLVDQEFVKEPRASARTAFHSDESYFNCVGEQCATFWIPLDVVDRSNGAMGYVPGSHRWGVAFKRNNFVSQLTDPTSDGEQLPDIEGNEEKFGLRYVESAPGDVLVHHYRTVHGATGNIDSTRIRRALALRYGGPDLRYHVRFPKAMTSDVLREGDPMDSPEFPVVWRSAR